MKVAFRKVDEVMSNALLGGQASGLSLSSEFGSEAV